MVPLASLAFATQATKNASCSVPGCRTNELCHIQVLAAMRAPPQTSGCVWDCENGDDRRLNGKELKARLVAALQKRGRHAGTATKEPLAIRIDRDVLSAFRISAPGRRLCVVLDWGHTHQCDLKFVLRGHFTVCLTPEPYDTM